MAAPINGNRIVFTLGGIVVLLIVILFFATKKYSGNAAKVREVRMARELAVKEKREPDTRPRVEFSKRSMAPDLTKKLPKIEKKPVTTVVSPVSPATTAKPPVHRAPMNPPVFHNAKERDQYREYWVREFVRRAEVYRKNNASKQLPTSGELVSTFTELFYLASAKGVDESTEAAMRRKMAYENRLRDFQKKYSVTARDIWNEAGDIQYGSPGQ